jgi:hypothetical protein
MSDRSAEAQLAKIEDRLDRLVNIDLGDRGVEHLYRAARERQGRSLVGAAAEALLALPEGGTVLMTTGSVTRAWISPEIGENDGPAGAAVIARALAIAKRATCVVLAEETLLASTQAIFVAAGLTPLPYAQARKASADGSLAAVVLRPYPIDDEGGATAAREFLDAYQPDLLFSSERVGRNEKGVYHNMRGLDYGMGRARVDLLFDEGLKRGIPVVAVGDGGNEIGMALVADAVKSHVPFGDRCACGCGGGLGATTGADVLVTAACSNWGCYAIAAALAARSGDARLLHRPENERRLLERGVEVGLINAALGMVDPDVDGIARSTHEAVVEMMAAIVRKSLG